MYINVLPDRKCCVSMVLSGSYWGERGGAPCDITQGEIGANITTSGEWYTLMWCMMHHKYEWRWCEVTFVCQYSSVLLVRNYSDLVTMVLHHTDGELYQVGRATSESSFMDLWQEIISQFITLSLCLLSEWQHKVCLHSLIITLQPWNITWLARVTCSFYLHQEVTPE